MNAVIESDKWCPDVCLITKRPFFMWLEHPTKGYVPTYGGPFDSYTLAEPNGDGTFFCERYDHDAGHWVDWTDGIDLRLIDNQREDYEYGTVATLQAKLEAAEKDAAKRAELLKALRNHIPYRDESGVIEFPLHSYGRIMQLAEEVCPTEQNRYVPDSECKQHRCANSTTGCFGHCRFDEIFAGVALAQNWKE